MISCGHNVQMVARISGIHRANVYRRLKRFKVVLPRISRHGHRGNWGGLSNKAPRSASAAFIDSLAKNA